MLVFAVVTTPGILFANGYLVLIYMSVLCFGAIVIGTGYIVVGISTLYISISYLLIKLIFFQEGVSFQFLLTVRTSLKIKHLPKRYKYC
jgi:hypothetical protein